MAKDFDLMENSNRSGNTGWLAVSDPARRVWLRGGLGSALAATFGPLAATLAGCATGAAPSARLGFQPIGVSIADTVTVPSGYLAQVIASWGEPVGIAGALPAFRPDGSNSAADQAVQFGMHHDGIQFYPLAAADGSGASGPQRGLLVMNHEYVDDGLLHPGGLADWSADKVRISGWPAAGPPSAIGVRAVIRRA